MDEGVDRITGILTFTITGPLTIILNLFSYLT
jgi:hypothetical protein